MPGEVQPEPAAIGASWVYRRGRQFRIDQRGAPWLREEVNQPNRYGVPRFDVDRDVFLP
jgi:hypothetical protein